MRKQKCAAILVLGDIGHSPRMRNHAVELTKNTEYKVYLVGYLESALNQCINDNKNIEVIQISTKMIDKLRKLPKYLYLFYAFMRIIIQIFQLFQIFCFKLNNPKPDFIMIQNPPSIPVLFILYLVCKLRRIKFIVDFHNYGFTILQLTVKNKFIIKMALYYEKFFGKRTDYCFCVSKAMQQDLLLNWKINSIVLYDKANLDLFKPISIQEKHNLFLKIDCQDKSSLNNNETYFTKFINDQIQYKEKRPRLIVSSTSWTKDEVMNNIERDQFILNIQQKDFGILLQALRMYEDAAQNEPDLFQNLYIIITGKGPEKEYYLQKISQFQWKFVTIKTLWLLVEDYPKLLAAADLGVCLHYSSSGYDLPMKVVDMLSVGLPVLAINYNCISELVQDNVNGEIFQDANDLSQKFIKFFKNFEKNRQQLEYYQKNALQFRMRSFNQEWKEQVFPIINQIENKKIKDK